MYKRVLSLATALILTLAFATNVFATEDEFYSEQLGVTLVYDAVPPHTHLGKIKLGNLWRNGEPCTWNFSVIVIDDSVESYAERIYIEESVKNFELDYTPFYLLLDDGKVHLKENATNLQKGTPTKENPYIFYNDKAPAVSITITDALTGAWTRMGYASLVLKKSEVAEFEKSGQLPFVERWGDATNHLDFSELKAVLSGFSTAPAQPTPTPVTPPITDSPSAWAVEQVNAAIVANLVPAPIQSKYTQATTRAEFAALAVALYESIKGEITGRTTFSDTDDINIQKAAYIGIVSGVGDNRFAPDNQLTREQAAVMLSRLADAVGRPLPRQAATFADNGSMASWAVEQVGHVQAAGIMSGVGNNTFAPKDPYTREQSIITVMRLYEIVR